MVRDTRQRRGAAQTPPEHSARRRGWRLPLTLLIAFAATYWAGQEFGLGDDELFGYVLASVGLVVASALVALLLFGVVRLFRR
ncbi:MAG TPA: hypothetical protein VIZ30_07590 [Pseudomonadales bacterium]